MTRPLRYPKPQKMAFQSLTLVADADREEMTGWAKTLQEAEGGCEVAKARLKARGLRYWERRGRRII